MYCRILCIIPESRVSSSTPLSVRIWLSQSWRDYTLLWTLKIWELNFYIPSGKSKYTPIALCSFHHASRLWGRGLTSVTANPECIIWAPQPSSVHCLHRETKKYLFTFLILNSIRGGMIFVNSISWPATKYIAPKLPRRNGNRARNSIAPSDVELIQVSGAKILNFSFSSELCLRSMYSVPPSQRPGGRELDILAIFIKFQYMYSRLLSHSYLQPRTLPAVREYWHTHPQYWTHASIRTLWQVFLVDAKQPPRLVITLEMDSCLVRGNWG